MLESVVVGVEHRTLGQEVKAVVVVKPGRTVDPDDLKAFVAETLVVLQQGARVHRGT